MAAAKKSISQTAPKNSLLDVAADLISNSGIDLETVLDAAAGAATKRSGSSKKKDSKSDSLISKLIPEKTAYPQFSEKTYWAIREKFQKNVPEKVTATTLTNPTGLKAETIKSTVLPALELMGLLKDGKPTSKLKAWINDSKYEDTCEAIRTAVYPSSLTKLDFNTKTQQTAIINWFKKNADVSETTAKKMLTVYLLLAAPKLKAAAAEKKATSTAKKSTAGTKKAAAPAAVLDSVKVTTRAGKSTITVKIVADEGVTKKALTDQFNAAAAEALKQMK